MNVPGNWTLHYDWSCSGSYGSTPISFNTNGTFSSPPYTGHWSQHDGQIVWRYDQAPTVYGGTAIDNAMVGINSTFGGLNGCWYALRVGTSVATEVAPKGEFDHAGNKHKK